MADGSCVAGAWVGSVVAVASGEGEAWGVLDSSGSRVGLGRAWANMSA